MTEADWLACNDPQRMLDFLRDDGSNRKLRLFACGCCRRIWHLLTQDKSRLAVDFAERYADGSAADTERRLVAAAALDVSREILFGGGDLAENMAACAARYAVEGDEDFRVPPEDDESTAAWGSAACVAESLAYRVQRSPRRADSTRSLEQTRQDERVVQVSLLRDIFGNPFRPVSLAPAILTWNDGTVVGLAQAAYDERQLPAGTLDTSRLVVLADALEEAGCTDADILNHLRGQGPHVRGCWAVDLLLGKG